MDYLLVKALHIISATVLVGTGLGSAWYLWSALRSGDVALIAAMARLVVRADWIFTTPSIIFQLLSGLWLVESGGWAYGGWIGVALLLYVGAGLCWLPVVWLQIRMHAIATACHRNGQALPTLFHRYARIWFWLGVPAFGAMLAIYLLMVFKRLP